MRAFAVALCLASVAGCNDAGKDVQRLSIGSPCVTSGDCGTGRYFCATGEPNGYCQRECGKDADCPDGSVCVGAGMVMSGACRKTCNTLDDCRNAEGYVCAPSGASHPFCDVVEPGDGGA